MTIVLTLTASLVCAAAAVRARRLVAAGLWLAATSALLALALAQLQVPIVAVIELSVGAGLVAVLVVFAVASTGEDGLRAAPAVSPRLAGGLTLLVLVALAWLALGDTPPGRLAVAESFARVFWDERALDVLGQVVLLFVAALGVRSLLGHTPLPSRPPEIQVDHRRTAETRQPEEIHA
jgi:uncharacterized MnhB-related membrane protein